MRWGRAVQLTPAAQQAAAGRHEMGPQSFLCPLDCTGLNSYSVSPEVLHSSFHALQHLQDYTDKAL